MHIWRTTAFLIGILVTAATAWGSGQGGPPPRSGGEVPPPSLYRGDESLIRHELELPPSEIFESPGTPLPENTLHEPDIEHLLTSVQIPESDIPLTLNDKVAYFITYFQTRGRGAFSRWLSRSERYIPMMKEILRKEGLPEDLVYLAMIESGFTPHAVSSANAVGPWQFISGTGKRYSLRIDRWIDERRDPIKSTVAAAMYLKELYSLFRNDWYLAAAGYNAGENRVIRALSRAGETDFWGLSREGLLPRETREYVPKLLAAAIIAKEPARFGFADIAYLPPIEFDTVTIPSRTDLDLVARLIGTTYDTLKELNPELLRWCTPPDYPDYRLKIPFGTRTIFEAEYAKIPEDQRYRDRLTYARYRVKKRDTLAAVARRFHTTPETLIELNHLSRKSRIAGKTLIVPVEIADLPSARTHSSPTRQPVFEKYYTVKKGDTINSIARKFNISEKILASWNNLKGKLSLTPGKKLVVARFIEKKNGAMVPAPDNS
ncbi:MAG: lytic transglycosylase domain-containing protein [Desulfuromonadia bacterium]